MKTDSDDHPNDDGDNDKKKPFDPRLKMPFTCLINGPSKSGKTHLVDYILQNQQDCTTGETFKFIMVCYQNFQPLYEKWGSLASQAVIFHRGIPLDFEKQWLQLFSVERNNLLVLDDVDVPNSREQQAIGGLLARLFTVYSHHRNMSIIYATHHLFLQNKQSVVLYRNADYLILLASPRDSSAVRTLGYQCNPGNSQFLLSAYKMATEKPHSFLLCDWTSTTPDLYRYRETFVKRFPLVCYREQNSAKHEEPKKKKR